MFAGPRTSTPRTRDDSDMRREVEGDGTNSQVQAGR